MKRNISHCITVLCALNLVTTINATILVQGNDVTPFSFDRAITTAVFDRATGTFYVGLENNNDDYALSKATRPIGGNVPVFSPIGSNESISGQYIEFLTLATCTGNIDPLLAVVTRNNTEFFTQTKIIASTNTGLFVLETGELNDASAMDATTHGIVSLAASNAYIFAGVRPGTDPTLFGDEGSGIALISICPPAPTDMFSLAIRDATTGDCGNKAIKLDKTSEELKGTGSDVEFPGGTDDINENKVAMYWDNKLERLYTGVRIRTGNGMNDKGKSVVVGYSNSTENNRLSLLAIAPDSAINAAADEIIVAEGMNINLVTKHIRVLHATTGPTYLIVNGGKGSIDEVGNKIRAIPLVDNPTNPTTHGTAADKNSLLIGFKFVTPATATGSLATDSDAAARVGSGDLPIEDAKNISDMMTIGDTVYVSIGKANDTNNDAGLFYSQALFDATGKIISWTPWTKRAFPYDGFETGQPGIAFFAVDAINDRVWAVDGACNRIVRLTVWTFCANINSLLTQLNTSRVACGACSVLDLDQSTNGFLCHTPHRYALFGAPNAVIFTRTSKSTVDETTISTTDTLNQPQIAVTDFSSKENFLVTTLPVSEPIRTIEYSRRSSLDNTNYFFAGTNDGLYVFAKPGGNGFNATNLGTLDTEPFRTGSWRRAPNLDGAIIALRTTGNVLYVLQYTSSPLKPMQYTMHLIPFASTINTMFSEANIRTIAQSSTDFFSTIPSFSDIEIMSITSNGLTEQLILATNQGIFNSSRAGGVQNATDQNDAAWTQVNPDNRSFFNGIAAVDNATIQGNSCTAVVDAAAPPTTVWPFGLRDPQGCKTFDRGELYQLNGTGPFAFVPENFNSIETTNTLFNTLYPIIYFWSDGGRRMAIVKRNIDASSVNKLLSLPFDTITWQAINPALRTLSTPLLNAICSFNWIKQIGSTGFLFVGTNQGIVALQ